MSASVVVEIETGVYAPTGRGWLIFAVSFALLLSDYMSRQVLSAVFPALKLAWSLSDAQLGSLGGAVPLAVGILTFPLSLLADRFGRARCVALMALTWSLATLACAAAAGFNQLMLARLLLGVGEAAYGSVGLAVVFTYFPRSMRATITSAFMAGGLFGTFAGLTVGGLVASHYGWRAAFVVMAGVGLALTAAYLVVAPESRNWRRRSATGSAPPVLTFREIFAGVFASRSVVLTYLASGVQLFIPGALLAWTPSYINRTYGVEPGRAAVIAAGLMLVCGVGMVVCGRVSDGLGKRRPQWMPWFAIAFCLMSFAALQSAFLLPPGAAQIACAIVGFLCVAGVTGPAGVAVADGAPVKLHGAALAVLTLSNNLIGFAPGSAVTGIVADHLGLRAGLQIAVCAALPAAVLFWLSAQRSNSKNGAQTPPGGKS